MEQTQCKNNACEYQPTIDRKAQTGRKARRYAQLWEEIQLSNRLKEVKTNE
jgi:hypothetical protein